MGKAMATGNGYGPYRAVALTSLDPDVFAVFGRHAHQEALPLGRLHLMQIVPWGPEHLVQDRPRFSQPHQSDPSPLSCAAPCSHPKDPTAVQGWWGAVCAQRHSPSLSAVGQRVLCAPLAPLSPHASSWWPVTCWLQPQGD